MSTTLRTINSSRNGGPLGGSGETESLSVTSFYGGTEDLRCIQLTMGGKYIGLTRYDVQRLIATLALWLAPDVMSEDAQKLFDRSLR